MTCKLVEFPDRNLNDIPRLLRQMADDIETGGYGEVQSLASVMETDAQVLTFGFGMVDPMRAIGLFTTGATMMAGTAYED